jgi:hypothetical protein
MIPVEMQAFYVEQVARYVALRPDLDGVAPSCGHCSIRDDGGILGMSLACPLSGEVRRVTSDCNTGGFTYDDRPLWEQYPQTTRREWEQGDGMLADSMRRIKEYVMKGGSMDDLPTLRLPGVTVEVNGQRVPGVLVWPPGKARDEYGLSETAYSDDAYTAHDLTQAVRDRQDARTTRKEAA